MILEGITLFRTAWNFQTPVWEYKYNTDLKKIFELERIEWFQIGLSSTFDMLLDWMKANSHLEFVLING